jgi:hypothetical protein
MTGVWFTADPDGLDALSRRLSSIETDMNGVGVALGSYDSADLSPDGHVLTALQEFNDAWADEMKTINENVSGLQQRLTGASTLYRGTDQAFSSPALPGMAAPAGVPAQQDGAVPWQVR